MMPSRMRLQFPRGDLVRSAGGSINLGRGWFLFRHGPDVHLRVSRRHGLDIPGMYSKSYMISGRANSLMNSLSRRKGVPSGSKRRRLEKLQKF